MIEPFFGGDWLDMWIQPFKNKDLIIKHLDLDAFGVHEDRFGGS